MKTLPLSATTKEALDSIRPRGFTYDQVLRTIMGTRPLDEWREFLETRPDRDVAVVLSNLARRAGAPSMRREPSEQILLADSARQRWQLWKSTGRVEVKGERRMAYRTRASGGPRARIRRLR